jgi:hypothetical protein
MRRNDHPRARVGVRDGVLDKVSDRYPQLARVTQHASPRSSGDRESDPAPLGVHPSPLDSVSQHLIDLDNLWISDWIIGLKSRELDDLTHQIGQSSRLDTHATCELAHRRRVVGGVLDRLSQ